VVNPKPYFTFPVQHDAQVLGVGGWQSQISSGNQRQDVASGLRLVTEHPELALYSWSLFLLAAVGRHTEIVEQYIESGLPEFGPNAHDQLSQYKGFAYDLLVDIPLAWLSLDLRQLSPGHLSHAARVIEAYAYRDSKSLMENVSRNPVLLPLCWTMFIESIREGSLPLVRFFVDQGMPMTGYRLNQFSDCGVPVDNLIQNGQVEMFRYLVEHGAPGQFADTAGSVGQLSATDSLLEAAKSGNVDLVKFVVRHGGNLDSYWSGHNALMIAQAEGHYEVVDFLKSLGMRDLRSGQKYNYQLAHENTIEQYTDKCGEVSAWRLAVPGNPGYEIRRISMDPDLSCSNGHLLVTIGFGDQEVEAEMRVDGCVANHIELEIHLPPDWPFSPEALQLTEWNWPIESIKMIASHVMATRIVHRYCVIMNGEPPQPLGPGVRFCGWIGTSEEGEMLHVCDERFIVPFRFSPIDIDEYRLIDQVGADTVWRLIEGREWIDRSRASVAVDNAQQ
jgi:hypothetical protein